MNDLQSINESNMLNNDEIKSLSAASKDIETGFQRRQRFRPKFLMETAVLNDMKFPTPDSKYWQCNVERDTHFRNLVNLSFDYREKVVDIEILESEISPVAGNPALNDLDRKKIGIQIERENISLVYMQKEAQERVREIKNWSDIMTDLKPQLKYDPEDVEAHMPESYVLRAARETEVMGLALGQSDMNGAMNMIAVNKSILNHGDVQSLIEQEKQLKINE